jgi:hypothetical protein
VTISAEIVTRWPDTLTVTFTGLAGSVEERVNVRDCPDDSDPLVGPLQETGPDTSTDQVT